MSAKLKFTPFRNISTVMQVKMMTFFNLFKNNKIINVSLFNSLLNRNLLLGHLLSVILIPLHISIALVLSFIAAGCDDVTSPPTTPAENTSVKKLDRRWIFNSDAYGQVEVQVRPASLGVDKTMICIIQGESGGLIHYRLYDDGGLGTWDDSKGWAAPNSGDKAPGDGIFSRQINSKFASRTGVYEMIFIFTSGPPPDSTKVNVTVIENSPPVIIRHQTPEFIASGSDSDTFRAIVGDPNGFADIERTEMVLTAHELGISGFRSFPMQRIDDSTWTLISFPDMAAGIHSRPYNIVYKTVDNVLSQSQIPQWIYGDRIECRFENLPPEIANLNGPDTVRIPREDTTSVFYYFNIEVRDDQGINDLDTLFVSLSRDGDEIWQNFLIDGEGIDTTAGDGIYRAKFSASKNTPTIPISTLNWKPSDKTGQRGETYSRDLVFIYEDGEIDSIEVKTLNDLWILESEVYNQVEIRVSPSGIAADRTIICLTKNEAGDISEFRLYDDGGLGNWDDSPEWAASESGDTVFGDGVFSRMVNSKFARTAGDYELTFAFTDGPPPDSLRVLVSVIENSPPIITQHLTPEFLASGSDNDIFTAIISDANGYSDVERTELILNAPELGESGLKAFSMQKTNDSTWIFVSIPSMAARLSTGQYQVNYRTVDQVLSQGDPPQWVNSDLINIDLENLPPEIMDFTGPDTVRIPREDTTTVFFHFVIETVDDQTTEDLDSLFLSLVRDEEEIWSNYYIDGEGIDSTSGDGIFKAGFSANRSNPTHVIYTFNWTPSDRAGQRGETYSSDLVFMYDDEQMIHRRDKSMNRIGYIPFSVINRGFFQK